MDNKKGETSSSRFEHELSDSVDSTLSSTSEDNEKSVNSNIALKEHASGIIQDLPAGTYSGSSSHMKDTGTNQSSNIRKIQGKQHLRDDSGRNAFDHNMQRAIELEDEHLSPYINRDGLQIEHITKYDEVWIMQCPISINPDDLKNKNIDFEGVSDLKIQQGDCEQHYEISSSKDMNKSQSFLLPTSTGHLRAKVLQPKGLITVKEKIDVANFGNFVLPKQRSFQIPEGLKRRHPLFGPDYEVELKRRKAILKNDYKQKRKRNSDRSDDGEFQSHKKNRKIENLHVQGNTSGVSESENRQKRKRKKNDKDNFFNDYESEIGVHKRKKNDNTSDDESEKVREKKQDQCIDFRELPYANEDISFENQDFNEAGNIKKKKNKKEKRKKKYEEESTSGNEKNQITERNDFTELADASEEVYSENQGHNGVKDSEIKKKHKKEKRKKKCDESTGENNQSTERNDFMELPYANEEVYPEHQGHNEMKDSKIKKKHKKEKRKKKCDETTGENVNNQSTERNDFMELPYANEEAYSKHQVEDSKMKKKDRKEKESSTCQ